MGSSIFDPRAARSKRPCPIWVDAFHRETQHLSADEIGAYFLIIMAMWSRKSCDFPNNERQLAQVSRVSTRLWKSRIGVNIMGYFDVIDGCVISSKLRKEATYVERHVTQQHCRKTGENPSNILKNIEWHQTADKPRTLPTQQPNNPTYKEAKASYVISDAILFFNSVASECGWPCVKKMSSARKSALKSRIKDIGGYGNWKREIQKAASLPHLVGNNDRGWVATFDWLHKDANFTKLIEGNYDENSKGSQNAKQTPDPILASIARLAGLS